MKKKKHLHRKTRKGFTLVELGIAVGVVSILAAVAVRAIAPKKNITSSLDSVRKNTAEQVRKGFEQYFIDNSIGSLGKYPGETTTYSLPTTQATAIPLCADGYTPLTPNSPVCIDSSGLITNKRYLPSIPRDSSEKCPQYSGYLVWKNNGRVKIEATHLGKTSGDKVTCSSGCPTTTAYTIGVCTSLPCGNGVRENGEGCDDGNTNNGDGCSSVCQIVSPYICNTATPNVCANCGNGICASGVENASNCAIDCAVNCTDNYCSSADLLSGTCNYVGGDCDDNCYNNNCSPYELGNICGNYGQDCNDAGGDNFCSAFELQNNYPECEYACDGYGNYCSAYEMQNEYCYEWNSDCQDVSYNCFDDICSKADQNSGQCTDYGEDCNDSYGDDFCSDVELQNGYPECSYSCDGLGNDCSAYEHHHGLCMDPGYECEEEVFCSDNFCSAFEYANGFCDSTGRDCEDDSCSNGWCSPYESSNGLCQGMSEDCDSYCYDQFCSPYESQYNKCHAPGQDCY